MAFVFMTDKYVYTRVPEVLSALQDIDETSKRKIDILDHFVVSIFFHFRAILTRFDDKWCISLIKDNFDKCQIKWALFLL